MKSGSIRHHHQRDRGQGQVSPDGLHEVHPERLRAGDGLGEQGAGDEAGVVSYGCGRILGTNDHVTLQSDGPISVIVLTLQ